jgi:exopolysaccharide biosynthesis protein
MKQSAFLKIFLFVVLIASFSNLYSQIKGFEKIKWQKEKIAPGLIWKYTHSVFNDSLIENINVLEVNLRRRHIALNYNHEKNIIVSKQAAEAKALAAVNAGFFNIKNGGSATYIRTGGMIQDSDTASKWSRNSNMTGSLLIDKSGNVIIDSARSNKWYDNHQEYPDVLVTGPLLVLQNIKVNIQGTPLVITKHPRTVMGRKGNHKIILVTIDGRTDQARGMTLYDVADLMISLRCMDAVNLDGGGSTAMYISGKPFNGIVNMPCDNKKFDHAGERAVSDIIIVR